MKKVLLIGGGILFLLLAALVAIPFLIPMSQYKAQIEAEASKAIGREFKINGPIRFAFWPTLGIKADDVTIANARGGKTPLFATMGELDIGVKPMPLLSGDIQIERLIVRKPVLSLEEDAGGKPNWIFEATAQAGPDQKPAELKSLGLDDLRIEDGALTYTDRLGATTSISEVGAQAKLESLDAPFALTSDFLYNKVKTDLKLDLQSPRAMLKMERSPLKLEIDASRLGVNFDGMIDFKDFSLDGKFDAKGPSLRQLCAWTGNPIGEGGGFGAFAAAGGFRMNGPKMDISNATFALDAAKGKGHIAITMDPTGKPPYVSGTVALDALDVNPYLGPPAPAGGPTGVNVAAPWGNAPLDMSGLKAINADLNLTTGALLFQKMKMDSSAMKIALKDGVMTADLNKLVFYGGTGTGVLIMDGRNPGMRLGSKLAARGVSAEPFLTDAIGFNKVQGKANIDLDIKGLGVTQQALMNTLQGTAKFSFEDGALKGVNLAQVARQVQSVISGTAVGEGAKTDFAELAASFTLLDGVASTKDGRMLNPFIRVTGVGDLDVARQQINMKVTPTVVKVAEGQGGAFDLKGLSVPFTVKGPWAKISFAPALGEVFQSKAQSAIDKQLGKVVEKNNLGGILGGKNADGTAKPNPLSNLFGKKKEAAPTP